MTTLFLFVRLAPRLLALPGRLLVRWIDGRKAENGVPPLGRFLRGCVHGFVWLVALMAISMATMSPAPAPVVPTPRPTPINYAPSEDMTERERRNAEPTPTTSPPAPTSEPGPVYVPLPDGDDDHDWDKPRICHRKWWC